MNRFLANASAVASQQHYTTDIALAGLSYSSSENQYQWNISGP